MEEEISDKTQSSYLGITEMEIKLQASEEKISTYKNLLGKLNEKFHLLSKNVERLVTNYASFETIIGKFSH